MMKHIFLFAITMLFFIPFKGLTQNSQNSILQNATLSSCIQYTLTHQPIIQQSLIDEKITEETIRTKLADWYPQLNLNAYYQNDIQLSTSYFSGNYVRTGTNNISGINFTA